MNPEVEQIGVQGQLFATVHETIEGWNAVLI